MLYLEKQTKKLKACLMVGRIVEKFVLANDGTLCAKFFLNMKM